jgi:hypothetical protein
LAQADLLEQVGITIEDESLIKVIAATNMYESKPK